MRGAVLKPVSPGHDSKTRVVKTESNRDAHSKFYGQGGVCRDGKEPRSDSWDLNITRKGRPHHPWCRMNTWGPLPTIAENSKTAQRSLTRLGPSRRPPMRPRGPCSWGT